MRWLPVFLILTVSILLVFGCAVDEQNPGGEMAMEPNFQLSVTDDPLVDRSFDALYIDFDRIEVSRETGDYCEWIPVTEEGGTVDLLQLTDGNLHTLVVSHLEPGVYHQLRFHVNRTWAVEGKIEHEVKLSSGTIKLVREFEIKEGVLTRLIADFDAYRSLKRIASGRFVKYLLVPVIRIVHEDITGGIAGCVIEPKGVPVTISAYLDGESEVYATALAGEYFGFFLLAYLEEGLYDVVIEADGYLPYRIEDVQVYAGCITPLKWVSLEPKPESASITVNVVNTTGEDLENSKVHVTSFSESGDLPDNQIEAVDGVINGGGAVVMLDRGGAGYAAGTYELRAHIDVSGDGLTGGDDYVTLGEVTVSGSDVSTTLQGPWGGYVPFMVTNLAFPSSVADSAKVYLVVVAQGDDWGNYSYGKTSVPVTQQYIGMDMWAPDGTCDFHAMIDVNGNFDTTGAPDPEDYTYENPGIVLQAGVLPEQTITGWE